MKFPPLSGIDFDGVSGGTSDSYVSDSVMPGDDNTKPQPNWTQKIFDAWNFNGGVDGMGVPWDAAGAGPGVHQWANGVVQDFANQWGTTGIIMLKNGAQCAHGVYGDIFLEYLDQGGASAWMGYPTSGEYTDINGIARRSDFEGGFICWQAGNTWVVDWDVRWWC